MLAPLPLVTLDLTGLRAADEKGRKVVWDTLQAASALQGIVNRKEPRLYLFAIGDGASLDRFWLKNLESRWLKGGKTSVKDLDEALRTFRSSIKGAVVWDPRIPATSNVASTIAGVEDLIPLRYDPSPDSLYTRWTQSSEGPKLTILRKLMNGDGSPMFPWKGTEFRSTGSAKCDAYLWAAENYLKKGKCDPGTLAYYPDAVWLKTPRDIPWQRTLLTNHDYFVAKRAFFFDLSPWDDTPAQDDPHQMPGEDGRTLRAVLRKAYDLNRGDFIHVGGFIPWDQKYTSHTGSPNEPVPTEWRYAEVLSNFNAYMDADAAGLHAMANASVFTHEPLKASYPQKMPTEADLRAKGYLDASGKVVPKAYAAIYGGDYDAASWLYTKLPEMWDEPERGSIPVGWAFNPALSRRFPTGLAWTRDTAKAGDVFIAGDSGMGYLNPGYLTPPRPYSHLPSGLPAWEKLNLTEYKKWGLGVTGFVIDGYAPPMAPETLRAYARFSPNGVVAQKLPERLQLIDGVPFLRMSGDLTENPTNGAKQLVSYLPPAGPASFSIARTILWGPKGIKEMADLAKVQRPDLEMVDPYTLFLLAKISLR